MQKVFSKNQKLSVVFSINLSSQSNKQTNSPFLKRIDKNLTKPVQYLNLRDLTFREAWHSPVHCSAVLPSSSNSSLVFPIKLLRNFPLERCLLVPKSGASNKSFTPSDACLLAQPSFAFLLTYILVLPAAYELAATYTFLAVKNLLCFSFALNSSHFTLSSQQNINMYILFP